MFCTKLKDLKITGECPFSLLTQSHITDEHEKDCTENSSKAAQPICQEVHDQDAHGNLPQRKTSRSRVYLHTLTESICKLIFPEFERLNIALQRTLAKHRIKENRADHFGIASTSSVESMPGADGGGAFGGTDSCRKSSKSKRDKEKQACKSCSESFNSITKRRHHCKQCGAVICAKCSEFKPLADNSRHNRVCKDCFQQLSGTPWSPGFETGDQKKRLATEKQSILAAENSLFSSYLQFLEKGKTWHKMWVTIPKSEPLVLYLQGSSQDGRSPRPIPLPGYEVSLPGSGDKFEVKHVFKLCQSQQTIYFSAEDEELQVKWMEILSKAAKGETEDTPEGLGNP